MSPFAGLAVMPSGFVTPCGSTAKGSTSRSMNRPLPLSARTGPAAPSKKSTANAASFFFMNPLLGLVSQQNEKVCVFFLAITRKRPVIPPGSLSSGCDGDSADLVARDRLRHEPRSLHVLREFSQVACCGGPALRRAHRLLHDGESAIQDARPGKGLG